MKRYPIIVVLFIAVCLLFSCASGRTREVVDEYTPYVSPWKTDVISQAKEKGTLNFWFMASEGYNVASGSEAADKWGDSFLIVFPDGETMLVDCGFAAMAPIITRTLQNYGITRIDYFVLTHPHSDHAGSIAFTKDIKDSLLENFEIGKCYYTGVYNTEWSDPKKFENLMDSYGIPREVLQEGDELDIGGVHLTIINPPEGSAGTSISVTQEMNNSSLTIRMDYGEFSALLTGDLYESREMELVKKYGDFLDVDLLKIPHHGHQTSTSEQFVRATSPEVAVGIGHVLLGTSKYSNLLKSGAKAVLMDIADGYIHVWSDGKNDIQWETSRTRTITNYEKYDKAYSILNQQSK